MEERTTRTSVTFSHPFSLTGIEGRQPAGVYRIEAVDVLLDNAPYLTPVYRRISTTIELPAVGASSSQRQLSAIDSRELETALKRDAACQGKPDTGCPNEFQFRVWGALSYEAGASANANCLMQSVWWLS